MGGRGLGSMGVATAGVMVTSEVVAGADVLTGRARGRIGPRRRLEGSADMEIS